MPEIIVIAHNIRSTHNVGAIFRTAEGFGISKIILSGYSPYPLLTNGAKDTRLPHIAEKLHKQIHKTALGAEEIVPFEYVDTPDFSQLRSDGFTIVGLEQAPTSILLPEYSTPEKIALVLGEEVEGIPKEILEQCEDIIEIPMKGKKESFNVSVAAGVALYELSVH
ncbi:TrmH family RNA methyltransferase [Candidatus Saccharibacteria bacterium TM7i]|nr:TrmH family RNA methyltransferase [Candidatus Saccharibacteria bacterium TM7i]